MTICVARYTNKVKPKIISISIKIGLIDPKLKSVNLIISLFALINQYDGKNFAKLKTKGLNILCGTNAQQIKLEPIPKRFPTPLKISRLLVNLAIIKLNA